MFTFATAQTANFSSNAFLVRNGRERLLWNGRVGASFVLCNWDFTPRLTFEQDWFRYDRFSELISMRKPAIDLKYDLNRDDTWFVDGSYAPARLSHPTIRQVNFTNTAF
jgi:hypothetical protein